MLLFNKYYTNHCAISATIRNQFAVELMLVLMLIQIIFGTKIKLFYIQEMLIARTLQMCLDLAVHRSSELIIITIKFIIPLNKISHRIVSLLNFRTFFFEKNIY